MNEDTARVALALLEDIRADQAEIADSFLAIDRSLTAIETHLIALRVALAISRARDPAPPTEPIERGCEGRPDDEV